MFQFLGIPIRLELVRLLLLHLHRPVLPQAEEKGRAVRMATAEKKKAAAKVSEACHKVSVMSNGVVAIV